MAKIGTLEVGTIKIANGALTGSADGAHTVSVSGSGGDSYSITLPISNSGNLPVQLYWSYSGSGSAGTSADNDVSVTLTRTLPSSVSYYSKSFHDLNGTLSQVAGASLDMSPGTSPTYVLSLSVSCNHEAGGGTPSATLTGSLAAIYFKK